MNHIFFSESDICSPTRVARFTNASYETVLFSEAEEYSEISIVRFSINWLLLKDNSGAKWTFGLITHCYLFNRYLRFVFMTA